MKFSFKGWFVSIALFALSAVGVHYAYKKYVSPHAEPVVTVDAFQGLVADENLFLKNSEVHISFQEKASKTERRIAASASDGKFLVFSDNLLKDGTQVSLEEAQYRQLLEKLRQMDERELVSDPEQLFSEAEGTCREVYKVFVRVGQQERSYFGCRGEDANATQVSKIVRELEHFLVKSSDSP